ncbi:hypothetical protein A9404_03225 [Halothiobacillus diazotrophicus]|uniref:SIS domain-containing protein n=1 Tax=Halothiobacillus diazotrophicus TaxID=1860122 RepID=A0A191ZF71_9GAMM|nr:SIS domain-containing protein [Halothiobacillus diazotrophicus]ANJ66519.1 hypothetical protein A9404_03225 [Halothiobacillus diazotrophicus]
MTDMLSIVQNRLHQTLSQLDIVLAPQVEPLLQAAGAMLHTVLNGQKILVCGARERSQLAAHFARLMVGQFEHERPGLPVISLQEFPGGHEPYAKAIRALGAQNDVLFAIARHDSDGLQPALKAARERGMVIVLLTSGNTERLMAEMSTQDSLLCLESNGEGIVHEAQLILIHALCDLIDRQLLGITE